MAKTKSIGTDEVSTEKRCAHCSNPIGFQAFVEFLKDGYVDSIKCDICNERNYLERPGKNAVDGITTIFAVLLGLAAYIFVNAFLAFLSFDPQTGSYRIFAWGLGGGLFVAYFVGRLFLSLRKWQASYFTATEDLSLDSL